MLATLLLAAGDLPAAHAMAERALAVAGDQPQLRAAALCAWVQVVADGERRYEGLGERLEEALRLAQGHPELLAQATSLQGTLAARDAEDPVAAEAFFDQAAAHWLAAGRTREARLLRYDRALCLCKAGQLALALLQAELCERECAAIGERARRVAAINLQGVILALQRRWGDAVQAYRRCVAEAWTQHQHYWLSFALWNHGRNLARLRQPEAAARLMAFSERHWITHFGPLTPADQRHVRQVRRLVACQLGAPQMRLLWSEGAQLTLRDAVQLALHLGPAAN
jgi:tetratricopeptide (TPR) repeat protein